MLKVVPVTFKEAREFVAAHHRHHKPPVGMRLAVGVEDKDGVLRGVACGGRPVARRMDQRRWLEITRVCTDGAHNACSMLVGAIRTAAKHLGYERVLTYTMPREGGASLRAAGFRKVTTTPGRSWDCPSRPREDSHPLLPRWRWEWP